MKLHWRPRPSSHFLFGGLCSMAAVIAVATIGCSSDGNTAPGVGVPQDDGGSDGRTEDGGAEGGGVDGGPEASICSGSPTGNGCAGISCGPVIDDMRGPAATQIAFAPPSCATAGYWFAYESGSPPGMITDPSPIAPFSYSPLPQGPPPALPDATVGACLAGVTSTQQFQNSGEMVVLARSSGSAADSGALPALIDASAYLGIRFWLWKETASVQPDFGVVAFDEAETPGWGVCDPLATGSTACGGTIRTLTPQAGWQRVELPWTSFIPTPTFGGANETKLDATTLTRFNFRVAERAAGDSVGNAFNFCVLDLSFY